MLDIHFARLRKHFVHAWRLEDFPYPPARPAPFDHILLDHDFLSLGVRVHRCRIRQWNAYRYVIQGRKRLGSTGGNASSIHTSENHSSPTTRSFSQRSLGKRGRRRLKRSRYVLLVLQAYVYRSDHLIITCLQKHLKVSCQLFGTHYGTCT